jgi:hypothetical protein
MDDFSQHAAGMSQFVFAAEYESRIILQFWKGQVFLVTISFISPIDSFPFRFPIITSETEPIIEGEKWLINLWIWDPVYEK